MTLSLQLAKLCFEHTKESADTEMPALDPRVYALLNIVAEECRKEDIQKAIDAAFRDLAEIEAAEREQRQREAHEEEEKEEGQMETEGKDYLGCIFAFCSAKVTSF